MQILNICLVILFIIFGYLMIIHVDELLTTHLGGDFLIALALFWFARGLQEIYFFRLRTRRSKVNLMLCILAAGLFLTPGLGVLSA